MHSWRQVLGDHVDQKGSAVLPDKLRFDFTHSKPISTSDVAKIEDISSRQLQDNLPVFALEVPLAQAKQIEGILSSYPQNRQGLQQLTGVM